MPFDLQKVTGTWKSVRSSDNFKEILKKMGVPAEHLDMMATAEHQMEVMQVGNSVTSKRTTFGKAMENTFTLGVEYVETDPAGTKRKVTTDWEGDAMVSHYPSHDGKGLVLRLSRTLMDDKTMRTEYKIGGMEGWMEAKKM